MPATISSTTAGTLSRGASPRVSGARSAMTATTSRLVNSTSGISAAQVAEGGEQRRLHLLGNGLDGNLPEARHRLLQLLQIGLARGSALAVLLEASRGVGIEDALEVVGDQPDELL